MEKSNTTICLLGFDNKFNDILLSELKIVGYSESNIQTNSSLDNKIAHQSDFPIYILFDDGSRKNPTELVNSLKAESDSPITPLIVVAKVQDDEREKLFYSIGIYDYLLQSDISASSLDKTIRRTSIQHQPNIYPKNIHSGLENEHRFKTIAENSLDFIAILSPGLIFTYVAPSIHYLLGYTPEELLSKNPFQIFVLEDVEKIKPKVIRDERLERYHYKIKHKNGDDIWFETTLKPLYDHEGKMDQLFATSKNITHRKRLSFMLEEMQHLARVGGWEYYLEEDKIYGTKEIANIFGIDREQHLGFRSVLAMFTNTSQKMIERELSQSLEYGKSWDLELSFYDNKNQIRWVRTVGRAYYLNGKVVKIGGTLQDISERVNYEELLYKKQSELKAFVENTPAAIAMFDKNMRYIAATNRWCQDYSLSENNIIGSVHHDIFPKSSVNWKKIYEKCLAGNIEKKEEDKFLFPDGKVEWLKWEIRPWYNYKNEIGGLIAMSEIITSRKEAEELSYQQQKRMREIYQITSDITGDISDRIKKVIEKATLALDMDVGILSKIAGNSYIIKEHFDPEQLLDIDQRVYHLTDTLCNVTYAENGLVGIGSLADSAFSKNPTVSNIGTASYIGVPIWKDGHKYGTLSFSSRNVPKEEISQADQDFVQLLGQWIGAAIDRRTFEREIVLAKEKAEDASKTKAQFVSTMSHEIRTPLNAVVGITHLLLEQDPKQEQLKNLQTLQFSANNLLALINDILDFSKIESGKIEIELIEYDLRLMLERLYSMLEFKANEKDIDLNLHISPALPNIVKGDPTRLNQIITNLVSNAIKFTEIGGVNLTVDVMEETTKNIAVKFTVTDTGIGIPKEKLSNIFDSFTQASADTSRKYGGTGLGLSISKKLAEMQGGNITVESIPGKGSAFTVNLTMEKVSAEVLTNQKEIEVSEEISLLGAVVLLVEDNEVNQLVAKQFLAKKEIRVVVAGNGLIALEKIKSMEFDLVLMDLQMPVMDGYEAAMKIRSLSGKYFQEVPIIALTASTMSEVRKKVLTSGMNDYISKPFVPDTFYSCLYKYIQKSPIRSKDFSNSEDVEDIIQYDKVLQFSFGEMTFYKELLEKIKEEFKTFQVQFYAAACENNLEKISFLKHRLSSSLKILGQEDLDSEIESVRVLISNNNPPENVMDQAGSIKNSCLDIIKSIERELEKSSQENYN